MRQFVFCSVVLSVLACGHLAVGFPNGATPATCNGLTPGHGSNVAQSTPSPYNYTSYYDAASGRVIIELNGPPYHRGLHLQVRDSREDRRGILAVTDSANYQLVDCTGRGQGGSYGITHTNRTPKMAARFEWTPPDDDGTVTYEIAVTTVFNFSTFWVNQRVALVAVPRDPTTTSYSTAAPVATTAHILCLIDSECGSGERCVEIRGEPYRKCTDENELGLIQSCVSSQGACASRLVQCQEDDYVTCSAGPTSCTTFPRCKGANAICPPPRRPVPQFLRFIFNFLRVRRSCRGDNIDCFGRRNTQCCPTTNSNVYECRRAVAI